MEQCEYYPPSIENITAANLAIKDSLKNRDLYSMKMLVGEITLARVLCSSKNDLTGAEAYSLLLETRLIPGMEELFSHNEFMEAHS